MKYLVVLVVVVLGIWLWRSQRRADEDERRAATPPKPPPLLEIVACPVCGVHLPAAEAVQGQRALYCSADHRHQAER